MAGVFETKRKVTGRPSAAGRALERIFAVYAIPRPTGWGERSKFGIVKCISFHFTSSNVFKQSTYGCRPAGGGSGRKKRSRGSGNDKKITQKQQSRTQFDVCCPLVPAASGFLFLI